MIINCLRFKPYSGADTDIIFRYFFTVIYYECYLDPPCLNHPDTMNNSIACAWVDCLPVCWLYWLWCSFGGGWWGQLLLKYTALLNLNTYVLVVTSSSLICELVGLCMCVIAVEVSSMSLVRVHKWVLSQNCVHKLGQTEI